MVILTVENIANEEIRTHGYEDVSLTIEALDIHVEDIDVVNLQIPKV